MLWFAQGSASRQCRGRRRATAVGWRDLREWNRGVAGGTADGRPSLINSLRWKLDLILDQRGADMADLPGGASGLLVRDFKGKNADRLVTRIAPGVVSLVPNCETPQELAQWTSTLAVGFFFTPKPVANLWYRSTTLPLLLASLPVNG
jgi:hypothetical protein